jgi:hypothetical protein
MFWKRTPKPTITFRNREDLAGAFPKPNHASKFMPDWLKKLDRMVVGAPITEAGTVKRCVPVLDAVTNGYILPLWADMVVTVKMVENKELGVDGLGVYCEFPSNFGLGDMIGSHGWEQLGDDCPVNKYKLGRIPLKFTNPWVIETSPGYSVLIKSPPHQYSDLHIMEGVVDTDTYKRQVNFPFLWTGDKEGVFNFPKGYPLVHVVPFKRQKVQMEIKDWDHEHMTKMDRLHDTHFFDRYRKLWWSKRK